MNELEEIRNYDEYKTALDKQMKETAEGFVRIGYLLKLARDTDILKWSAYTNVIEFARVEYGLDKTMVSRFISINDRFSENGNSPVLKTSYKGFGYAKLGQCVGIEEIIYYMFKQDMIVQPQRAAYPIAIGIDYGQMNATTYQAFGLDKSKKKFRGLKEYYYSGRDTGKQKSPSEYAEDFKDFFENLQEMYGIRTAYVFIDPSAKGLAEEIRRKCPVIKIVDAQNDVQLGIARTQKLMSYGILEVSPEQENLIHEAGIYEYDKKSIEAGKEVPVKTNDHCMDAMRYAVMGMWKYVRYFLPKAEQED